jgi:hypothetical protein
MVARNAGSGAADGHPRQRILRVNVPMTKLAQDDGLWKKSDVLACVLERLMC